MMKSFSSAAMAALVSFTIFSQPAHAAGPPDIPSAPRRSENLRLTRDEVRLVNAINDYREEHGLARLSVDPTLMRVARRAAPCFSHVVDGKWCWHRARQSGFRGWATDNIANGYPDPEDAVQGWATSDGHARQMRGYFKMNGRWCNYRFNRVGVGVCGRKYIAVFGCDQGGRADADGDST